MEGEATFHGRAPGPRRAAARGLLIVVGLLLVWSYTYRLATNPLKWEEPRRSLVAMEMISSGDYVVPRLLGERYLKKPPLQNWLIVLFSGNDLQRVGAVSVRLISLLALVGSSLFLWRLGVDGRPGRPRVAPVLIFLTMGTVLQSGRAGEIDTLFCFFVAAAFASFELGRRARSGFLQWFMPQIFVACGVLTKILAPAFFYPPVLYLAWKRRSEIRFSAPAFLLGLLSAAALVGVWLVPYSMLSPAGDLKQRWLMEIIVRTVSKGAGEILIHLATYPFQLVGWMLPWSLFLLLLAFHPASRRAARRAIGGDPYLALCRAIALWGIFMFLFVPEQKGRYLIPILPFVSVLVASFADSRLPLAHLARLRGFGRAAGITRRRSFWIVAAAVWTVAILVAGSAQLETRSALAAPLLAGLAAITACGWWTVTGRGATASFLLLSLGLLYAVFYSGVSEVREAERNRAEVESARRLAAFIEQEQPVVCQKGVKLEFCHALTRAIGRPLRREGRTGSSYWIARPGRGDRGIGPPLAESSLYALWEVEEPEAWSLLSEPLFPPALPEKVLADRLEKLEIAREAFEADSGALDAVVWLGRRTAYLGRYRDAVAIYSDGLESFPGEPELYRHRGHRYISLRRFDDAVRDLEHAARLVEGLPDRVEPDGLPNARNIPTSTLHSNIWYHLGLAYYLRGDLDNAARCYRECLKFSKNPDMLCATTHWLYMTLRRSGDEREAERLLEPIHAGMDVIENHAYHRLLLMYKGELSTQELMREADSHDGINLATVGYGVANWQLYNGRRDEARSTLRRVLKGEQWPAFGFIAAEADFRRIGERAL